MKQREFDPSWRIPFRQAIRWRLPAYFGALVVLMLLTFLAVAYREVTSTLVRTAEERAQIAADQIAGMLETALATRTRESVERARNPAVQTFLRDPTEANRQAVVEALSNQDENPLRRAELWNARGEMVLEISGASQPDSAGLTWEYPAGSRPPGAGVSTLRAVGNANYFDMVMAVPDAASPDSPPTGYLRLFGRITSNSASAVRRLVGDQAVVKIGSPNGAVWTDFTSVVEPPPGAGPPRSAASLRNDEERWAGATVGVDGSPWVVWVGFPRRLIVAPAQAFLQRMLALALLFVGGGVALVALLGIRLTQPLHQLAMAATEMAGGDHPRRVQVRKKDEIGRLSEAFNAMTDRIEKAHGAIKASHERTHFTLAAARIGVWESDLASSALACSDSMRVVHGRSDHPLPTSREEFLTWVHPDDREAVRDLMEGKTSESTFDVEYRTLRDDGTIGAIEGKGRVEADAAGRPVSVLGVSIDVTERGRLEAELRQAQKLEAVGRMAGGISHDFNNLLNVIKGCAYLLHQDLPDGSAQKSDAAEIERAADRAASLTQQLLAFSRKQVLQPKVLDPNQLVREVLNLLRRTMREDIDVNTDLDPRTRMVEVDPGQLHQVVMNLAINAQDAMPRGGRLTISTGNAVITEQQARSLPLHVAPGSYVRLTVKDTGLGMDPETRAQIFDPFFTTKELGKGTGLGLATVYGIVTQSGGYIWVDSSPGRGTEFQILLPRADAAAVLPEQKPPPPAVKGSGETILVVEDAAALRALFRTVLERSGYAVIAAANGEDALRVTRNHPGQIDLVISDVIMPIMSGPEMAARMSAQHGKVRIIFTSGYDEDEVGRYRSSSDSTAFLQKPIAPDELLEKVRELLYAGSTERGPGGGADA